MKLADVGASFARLPLLAYCAIAAALFWSGSLLYCYSAGKGAERSRVRDSLITRDRAVDDSLAKIRATRGAAATAAISANTALNNQLTAVDRRVAAARRTLVITDTTHVTIVDTTSGASHVVELPHEVVTRLRDDSTTIAVLSGATRQKDATINTLQLALSADTAALKQKDKLIADLNIAPPKPSLLDRALTSVVTSKIGKTAIVGGIVVAAVKYGPKLIKLVARH